jgi:hypothetical protein
MSEQTKIEPVKTAKRYRVSLSSKFKRPSFSGKPKEGVLYMRGGLKFTSTDGEGQSFHIIGREQYEKLLLAKHRTFDNEPVVYELDPMLYAEETK